MYDGGVTTSLILIKTKLVTEEKQEEEEREERGKKRRMMRMIGRHIYLPLYLNREGRSGTSTSFLHLSLFSTALWDLALSRPVHSVMLWEDKRECVIHLCAKTVL